MKNIKIILTSLVLFVFIGVSLNASAQSLKEVAIKTSFNCSNGKTMIENGLLKEAGVKSATANINNHIVSITYDEKITDIDKLVAAIEKIGFSTEYTPATKKIESSCKKNCKR